MYIVCLHKNQGHLEGPSAVLFTRDAGIDMEVLTADCVSVCVFEDLFFYHTFLPTVDAAEMHDLYGLYTPDV